MFGEFFAQRVAVDAEHLRCQRHAGGVFGLFALCIAERGVELAEKLLKHGDSVPPQRGIFKTGPTVEHKPYNSSSREALQRRLFQNPRQARAVRPVGPRTFSNDACLNGVSPWFFAGKLHV